MNVKRKESRRTFLLKSGGLTAGMITPGIFHARESVNDHAYLKREQISAPDNAMRAGFAELDITPELGMEQPGGYGKSYHRVFHDPCKVRAAVFGDNNNKVAIVGIDALIIRQPLVDSVRKQIQSRCGIAPESILIGASHSHSSGPTGMILPGEYDHANDFVKTLAYEKSSCADPVYLKLVEKQLVEVVVKADKSRIEADLGVGKGIEDKVAFNRRLRMKNGLTYSHPRQGNPDIIGYAGPVDPEVGVIGAWDKEGKCIGCIVNFACHGTTNPGGISANWIYYLEQTIRGIMGDDCVVIFLPGACGDVTQVDNLNPYQNRAGEEWTRFVGGKVGAEAVKVLLSMPRGNLMPVGSKVAYININRRVPDPARVKKCYEIAKQGPEKSGSTEWIFAKEIVLLDSMIKKTPSVKVEVQAIQVGPAVFISNPAEFFCQLGLNIKAGSPFKYTFPVELANDCVGYVPTLDAFGPNGGGYETRLTSYSNLDINAGDEIVNAGITLANQLIPGTAPEFPKAPEFNGKPWEYGSIKPELK